MNTITVAGNGRRSFCLIKALCLILVGLQYSLLQAADANPTDQPESAIDWRLAAQITLKQDEHHILLLEQQGADLVLQLRAGEDIVLTQDGPDEFFGTEVLVASNPGPAVQDFQLYVGNRLAAADYDFRLERISEPDSDELELAGSLSRIARLWHEDPRNPEIFALQEQLTVAREGSRLATLAGWHQAETLLHTSQYEQLLSLLESNQDQLLQNGNSLVALYHGWLVGRALRGQDRIEEALSQYRSLEPALAALQTTESLTAQLLRESVRGDWGIAQILLGLKLGNQDIMHSGAEKIEQAIAYSEPLHDFELLGDLTNYLYSYQSMLGQRGEAIATLEIADAYYQRSGNLASLATVKNNQAFNQRAIGDLSAAQQNYRQALQLLEDTASYRGYATVLSRLALTYSISGDYYRAETLFKDAIARFNEMNLALPALQAEIELGVVYRMQSRHTEAIALQNRLAERLQADAWLDEYVRVHVELARNYLAVAQPSRAAAAIAVNAPLRDLTTRLGFGLDAYAVEIEYLLDEGRYAEARGLAGQALQRIEEATTAAGPERHAVIIEPEQHLEILDQMARLELAADNWQEAAGYAQRAVALMSEIRQEMDFDRQGPTWHAKTRRVINTAAMINFDRYLRSDEALYLDQAFTILQSHNAVSLLENREHARRQGETENRGETTGQTQLWREMLDAKRRLLESSVRGDITEELELEAAMREEAYRSAGADRIALSAAMPALTINALQSRLQSNEAALLYSLAESRGHVLLITADAVQLGELPSVATLQTLIDGTVKELADIAGSRAAVNARNLAGHLLGTLSIPETIERLLVESNGLLSLVPFAGLPDPLGAGTALIDRYVVTRTPSLSLYYQGQNASASVADRLDIAIFADPEISLAEQSSTLEADWQGNLAPLPNTAAEASAIRDRFTAQAARVHTGNGATIANFLNPESRRARILHVATHGFTNNVSPDFIGLYFSRAAAGRSSFLTFSDLKEFHFGNELVVINGCETASGEVLPGEGMMGLSRTFLARGAKATIATLWPVSDAASARFMAYFYEELTTSGVSPGQALRNAQLRLRNSPQYRSPFYWAAYTLDVADSTLQPIQP